MSHRNTFQQELEAAGRQLAYQPAKFPDNYQGPGQRVVLIGAHCFDDQLAIKACVQALRLVSRGRALSDALADERRWDVYDISTKPEKGNALDHLEDEVALVVACHLYAIDTPAEGEDCERLSAAAVEYGHPAEYYYNRNNRQLLPVCMQYRIPLLVYGDQPKLGVQRETLLFPKPLTVLYRPEEALNA